MHWFNSSGSAPSRQLELRSSGRGESEPHKALAKGAHLRTHASRSIKSLIFFSDWCFESDMNAPLLFASPGEVRAAAALTEAVACWGECVVLSGEAGTCLTAVLDQAERELSRRGVRCVRVSGPLSGGLALRDLMVQIVGRAGPGALTDNDLEDVLVTLTQPGEGYDQVALLVDDAHTLLLPTVRYVQLVCQSGPQLRVVLAGRSSLAAILRRDEFAYLRQRFTRRLKLPGPASPMWTAPEPQAQPVPPARRRAGLWAVAGLGLTASLALVTWTVRWENVPSPAEPALAEQARAEDVPPPATEAAARVAADLLRVWAAPPGGQDRTPAMTVAIIEGAQPESDATPVRSDEMLNPAAAANPLLEQPSSPAEQDAAPAVAASDASALEALASPTVLPGSTATVRIEALAMATQERAEQPAQGTNHATTRTPESVASQAPDTVTPPAPEPAAVASLLVPLSAPQPRRTPIVATPVPDSGIPVVAEAFPESVPDLPAVPADSSGVSEILAAPPTEGESDQPLDIPLDSAASGSGVLPSSSSIAQIDAVAPPPAVSRIPMHEAPPVVANGVQSSRDILSLTDGSGTMPIPSPLLPQAALELLTQRGDQMLSLGDVSGARLLYGRAAVSGSSIAAVSMGRTFDPVFLTGIGAGNSPNTATAADWYRRAIALGSIEAVALLRRIEGRESKQ